jgi:uncharacterized protein YabE (DUF348 family)
MKLIHQLMLASKAKIVLSGIGVLALVLFTGMIVYEAAKSEVTIVDNGEEQVVYTHKSTVAEVLSEAGIAVGVHDDLSHEQDAPVENGMTIDYKTAMQVTVTIDGDLENFYTTEDTILAFLESNGFSFSDHDEVSHEMSEEVEDGLDLVVTKAFDVALNDGGEEQMVPATGGTVQELLSTHEIELGEEDKVEPALDETVTKDTVIDIVRVTTETVEVEEDIAFQTEKREDDTLMKGKEQVITQGENGQVIKKFKVVKENGEEISRELIEEEVAKERTDRVVAVGTKEPVQEPAQASSNDPKVVTLSNKSDSSPSGGKTLTVTASAFSASCNGCSGVTSTGVNLNANPNTKLIAVDPNVIPLGSRVWVEGYGEAIAGDTGGAIKGNRIDVHVPNTQEAHKWGVRTVQVKVLD